MTFFYCENLQLQKGVNASIVAFGNCLLISCLSFSFLKRLEGSRIKKFLRDSTFVKTHIIMLLILLMNMKFRQFNINFNVILQEKYKKDWKSVDHM
jgi:hypothetical protein